MTRVTADVMPTIRAALDGRVPGAEVRLDLPKGWTIDAAPVVVIADDGGAVTWPVKSRHSIRLTAWAATRTEARRLAARAAGELHAARIRGVVVPGESNSVIEARDNGTGARLASTLVPIHARTVEV